MSKMINDLQHGQVGKDPATRAFSCLGDLLAWHGRTAPDRNAILASGRPAMTYGALWAWANDAVHWLRRVGVGRGDRIAVVLPEGPEAAVTIIAVENRALLFASASHGLG